MAVVIVGAFATGWFLKDKQTNSQTQASFKPATAMIDSILKSEGIDAEYNNSSDLYKGTIELEALKQAVAPLKDAEITSFKQYTGTANSFVSYDLVKADSTYTVSISTEKTDGEWQVTSVIANKLTAQ